MRTGAGPPIRLRCAPLTRVGAEQDKAATLIAQLTAAAQAGLEYQEGQRILATCDHEPWYPALAAGGFSLDAAAWSQLGARAHYDPGPDLDQLTTPTLAIFGGNDPFYTMGQSSSIGVGISLTDSPGTFTAGGTYAVSMSQTTQFTPVHGPDSVYYETQVEPGLFKTSWSSAFCGPTTWQTQAIEIAGGAHEFPGPKTPPNATRCTSYQPGDSLVLEHSTASTFSVGLNINELGFNASAQTGYDSSGSLSYHVTSGQDLCGLDNYPAGHSPGPGLVVAGKAT